MGKRADHETGEGGVPGKKPGRKPLGAGSMSSTERNRRRVERLAATALAAEQGTQLLEALHRDLVAAQSHEVAARVAGVLRFTALKAVAEYARRNARFFVQDGSGSLSDDGRRDRQQYIEALVDKLDALASASVDRTVSYEEFELLKADLQTAGFFHEPSLTSAVARAFRDTE